MLKKLSDDLILGDAELDGQHLQLFYLVDTLEIAVENNDADTTKTLFTEFLEYVIVHFTHEEMLMYKVKYPNYDIERHRLDHKNMKDIYLAAFLPVLHDETSLKSVLYLFQSYFIHHIVTEDKLLASFIQGLQSLPPLSKEVIE